jgi:hypothetical protein
VVLRDGGFVREEALMVPVTFGDLMPEHGDVVIFVQRGGEATVARIRLGDAIHEMPVDVRVDYFADDTQPPLTPRRVTVKAGWAS